MQAAVEHPASAPRSPDAESAASGARLLRKAKAYVALTKPRVIELLLVTTAPVMMLAAKAASRTFWLVLATLVGGTPLAPRRANAFNCYIDRDIDRRHEAHAEAPARDRRAERRARRSSSPGSPASCRSPWLWVFTTWLAAVLSARRDPVLRARLHADPQAPHPAEHRLGRRRGLHAGAHRLGGRHGVAALGAGHPVRHRLPLDAAALLAAVDALPRRLRRRSTCRCSPSCAVAPTVGLQVVLYAWATVVCSLLLDPGRADGRALRGRRDCCRARGSSRVAPALLRRRSAPARSSRCGCSTPASPT